jgi:uncharacterized Zn finger protein
MGESARALEAATVAFRETPSLVAYLRVQELAGECGSEMRKELLAHLRRATGYLSTQAQVDVFLHEGLLDDAIAVVETNTDYTLIKQVMDAVVEDRPEWVINGAQRQADGIMAAGQSKHYHRAVTWLRHARTAYLAAAREADGRAHLNDIRDRHSRKYRLMEMLTEFE